ncbi:MAG: polysaccharide export protein, partial [Parabacteroides sp.]|nr:polysaccharide export protein [Parabacteroides sp.]
CSTPKDVVYFQGIDSLTTGQLETMSQKYITGITYDDLLSISVTAWDPASATPFNPPVFAYSSEGDQPIMASQTLYTYLVDREGYINFPVLGKIYVIGLTRLQLAEKLEEMISKYVENPLVDVQILNFKVTVMGEVNRPGPFSIKNDRMTILDALGTAGDLSITANRKNVLVIRENNGQKEIHRMDLTDPAIFASPGFYLKQNDVVYVEPIKNKQRARTSSDRQFTMSLLTSIISSISIITSMVITIVNLNN